MLARGLHEQREDGTQTQDLHKLIAVVSTLRPCQCVVQHPQRSIAGQLLLSDRREESVCLQALLCGFELDDATGLLDTATSLLDTVLSLVIL